MFSPQHFINNEIVEYMTLIINSPKFMKYVANDKITI